MNQVLKQCLLASIGVLEAQLAMIKSLILHAKASGEQENPAAPPPMPGRDVGMTEAEERLQALLDEKPEGIEVV